ncbi:MAG TPA: NAD(P)-dependent oxidoreductase [Phycisphaerae bacterium]|nr:NAD(P)-dependent oxidoreductase [Phycisphaerae bacterium]
MKRPVVVCAADLGHLPAVCNLIESAVEVRYVSATPEALAEALPDADAYFASMHVRITGEMMARAPRLRAIATPSTGLDHIDMDIARQQGIVVLSLKNDRQLLDRITATAELTWALILACARRFPEALDAVRRGVWARDEVRGHQIAYKTLGILGMGRLGSIVAGYGLAFRMNVIGCDVRPIDLPGVRMVGLDTLIRESDVLSIHIHLTDENRGLIGRERLQAMKPGSILINTSRGAIIDEDALLETLQKGPLAAAGLDVIEGEWRPDIAEHPLMVHARTHANLVITPHVGGVTYEAQEMAYEAAARKLIDHLTGPESPA